MDPRRWHTLRRGAVIALVLLLFALTGFQEWARLSAEIPVLRLFPDTVAQARARQGRALYDALSAADAILPRDSSVLLVTAGADPRHDEYVAFHRALYALVPRPIWWANPAPPDGTWESRWWIQTPPSAEQIEALAAERDADFILFYQADSPQDIGVSIPLTMHSTLAARNGSPPITPRTSTSSSPGIAVGGLFAGMFVILVVGGLVLAAAGWIDGHRQRAADQPLPLRGRLTATPVEAIGLAWACGAGCVTMLLLWLNAAGLNFDAQVTVISASALVALGVVAVRARNRLRWAAPALIGPITRTRLNAIEILLTVWIALQVAYVAVLALGRPLTAWDSWVTYALKARTVFLENQLTPNVYADASRAVTHLDYPLLVPLVEAWTFRWAGTTEDRLAGIPAVLFFVALLAVAFAGLRRLGVGRTHALAVVAVLASLPSVNGAAGAAMADVPLAVYALIAALFLARWRETRARGALWVAVLAAGMMPWTKREGLVLFAALLLLWIVTDRRERATWLAAGACVAAALALAGPWWLLIAREGGASVDFGPVSLAALEANGARLPVILYHAASRLLRPEWLLAWLIVPGVVSFRRGRGISRVLLPGTALVYLGAMSAAYVFSDFVPYQQHVVSSIDRLAVHVAPLVLVWRPWT
jgi:hypothetical protein